jgi:hypothetical protein
MSKPSFTDKPKHCAIQALNLSEIAWNAQIPNSDF